MPTITDRIGSTTIDNTAISEIIRNSAMNITLLIKAVEKQDHKLAMRVATDVKLFFDQIAQQFMAFDGFPDMESFIQHSRDDEDHGDHGSGHGSPHSREA